MFVIEFSYIKVAQELNFLFLFSLPNSTNSFYYISFLVGYMKIIIEHKNVKPLETDLSLSEMKDVKEILICEL